MAKVFFKVIGGSVKEVEAETVGELREEFDMGNNLATIAGSSVDDDTELIDGQAVIFAPYVKGN